MSPPKPGTGPPVGSHSLETEQGVPFRSLTPSVTRHDDPFLLYDGPSRFLGHGRENGTPQHQHHQEGCCCRWQAHRGRGQGRDFCHLSETRGARCCCCCPGQEEKGQKPQGGGREAADGRGEEGRGCQGRDLWQGAHDVHQHVQGGARHQPGHCDDGLRGRLSQAGHHRENALLCVHGYDARRVRRRLLRVPGRS